MDRFKEWLVAQGGLSPNTATVYASNVASLCRQQGMSVEDLLADPAAVNLWQVPNNKVAAVAKFKEYAGVEAGNVNKSLTQNVKALIIDNIIKMWQHNGELLPPPELIQILAQWTLGAPSGELSDGSPFVRRATVDDLAEVTWGALKPTLRGYMIVPLLYLDDAAIAGSLLHYNGSTGWNIDSTTVTLAKSLVRQCLPKDDNRLFSDSSHWSLFNPGIRVMPTVGNPFIPLSSAARRKAFDLQRVQDVQGLLLGQQVNYFSVLRHWRTNFMIP